MRMPDVVTDPANIFSIFAWAHAEFFAAVDNILGVFGQVRVQANAVAAGHFLCPVDRGRAIDEARNSIRFLLFGYVIMLDHVHLLTSRPTTTSDVLRVLKGITARRVIDYLKEKN